MNIMSQATVGAEAMLTSGDLLEKYSYLKGGVWQMASFGRRFSNEISTIIKWQMQEQDLYTPNISEHLMKKLRGFKAILYDFNVDSADFYVDMSAGDMYKIIFIHITIPDGYPLKYPKVEINGEPYQDKLVKTGNFIGKLYGVEDQGCLCCKSLLCAWGPTLGMIVVVGEVVENLELKRRIVDVIFAKYVFEVVYGGKYEELGKYFLEFV